jgi:hypothetical protein
MLVLGFDFDVPTFFGEASEELRPWAIKREDRRAAFARRSKEVILLAIAFKITSCSFIIRSIAEAEISSGIVNPQDPAPARTGQFTC